MLLYNGKQKTHSSQHKRVWGSASWRTPPIHQLSVGDFSDFFYPTIPVPISLAGSCGICQVSGVTPFRPKLFGIKLETTNYSPKKSCSTSPSYSFFLLRQSPFSPHHNDLHTFCNSPSHVGHSLKPSPTTSRFKASPKTWLPQWSKRNPKQTGLHKKSKWINGSRAEKERKRLEQMMIKDD